MYLTAVVSTLVAWVVGLFLDANIRFEPEGFLCFRFLFPMLAMGLCILHSIRKSKNQQNP